MQHSDWVSRRQVPGSASAQCSVRLFDSRIGNGDQGGWLGRTGGIRKRARRQSPGKGVKSLARKSRRDTRSRKSLRGFTNLYRPIPAFTEQKKSSTKQDTPTLPPRNAETGRDGPSKNFHLPSIFGTVRASNSECANLVQSVAATILSPPIQRWRGGSRIRSRVGPVSSTF